MEFIRHSNVELVFILENVDLSGMCTSLAISLVVCVGCLSLGRELSQKESSGFQITVVIAIAWVISDTMYCCGIWKSEMLLTIFS